jgi:FkbM family methyltransferase
VHAFEASSTVYARLSGLCDLTGRTNIVANHLAVSDTVGIVKLYLYDGSFSGWNSLADRPLSDYGIDVKPSGTEDVPATTIDAYCREHGVDRIDLLKIDVEGAEYQVLLGAKHMLEARKIRCIVFEFGQTTFDMGNDPAAIRTYLNRMGYSLRNVVKGDPIFPGGASVETARFSVHVAIPSS